MKFKFLFIIFSILFITSNSYARSNKVYSVEKTVQLCDGYVEAHLNKDGKVLDKNNKIMFPQYPSLEKEENVKAFNAAYCSTIKQFSLEEIKKNDYYMDGVFFKH